MDRIILTKTKFTPEGEWNLQEVMETLGNAQLMMMENAIKLALPEHKENLKETLYYQYNDMVSNILTTFAPELELRPDITAEAIMELEDQKLQERYDKMTDEEKETSIIDFKEVMRKKKE